MGTILMLLNHFGQITEVEKNELVPQISEAMQNNVQKFYRLAKKNLQTWENVSKVLECFGQIEKV